MIPILYALGTALGTVVLFSIVLVVFYGVDKLKETYRLKRLRDLTWREAYSVMKYVWAEEKQQRKDWEAEHQARKENKLNARVDKHLASK